LLHSIYSGSESPGYSLSLTLLFPLFCLRFPPFSPYSAHELMEILHPGGKAVRRWSVSCARTPFMQEPSHLCFYLGCIPPLIPPLSLVKLLSVVEKQVRAPRINVLIFRFRQGPLSFFVFFSSPLLNLPSFPSSQCQ